MPDRESEFCLCMNSDTGRALHLWPSLLAQLPVVLEAEGVHVATLCSWSAWTHPEGI